MFVYTYQDFAAKKTLVYRFETGILVKYLE